MNAVSEKTRNQNLLRTKTKAFKDNIKVSESRVRSSSSLHNLAGKLYSDKTNNFFTPRKSIGESSISKNASTGKLAPEKSLINPEMLMAATISATMSGLSLRASHVPTFADMNTTLLKEKKDLETRIAILKEGIVQEKKKLNNASYNCKKNRNQIENVTEMYNEAHAKSLKLNENIDSTTIDCQNLVRDIKNLRRRIEEKQNSVKMERKNIQELETQTKNLKISVMQEQKMRNQVKADLAKEQRVMNSASIYFKELENQKAMLLLEINQSVDTYKL